jgi:pyroglutamyl-peptidase
MTLLLTGFAPFGGETSNPSWDAIERLGSGTIAGHDVVVRRLPCSFEQAAEELQQALVAVRPSVLICVGQAGGRTRIGLERIAINVDDTVYADEAGYRPVDLPVIPGGPAAYFATVPLKATLGRLQKAGVPVEVSQTAGTFVCNHIFYVALHLAATQYPELKVGLMHVPYSPAQAVAHGGAPSMSLTMMRDAVSIAAEVALTTDHDQLLAAGSRH